MVADLHNVMLTGVVEREPVPCVDTASATMGELRRCCSRGMGGIVLGT